MDLNGNEGTPPPAAPQRQVRPAELANVFDQCVAQCCAGIEQATGGNTLLIMAVLNEMQARYGLLHEENWRETFRQMKSGIIKPPPGLHIPKE